MKAYFVQSGDTPKSITESKTGDYTKIVELLAANPHKQTTVIAGTPTFVQLIVGEQLYLPDNWPCCAECAAKELLSGCDKCRENCGGKGGGCLGFIGEQPNLAQDISEGVTDKVIIPLAIGVIALTAGIGLAYIVTRPPKSVAEITREYY